MAETVTAHDFGNLVCGQANEVIFTGHGAVVGIECVRGIGVEADIAIEAGRVPSEQTEGLGFGIGHYPGSAAGWVSGRQIGKGGGIGGGFGVVGEGSFDLAEAGGPLESRALAQIAGAEVLAFYLSPADLQVDGDGVGVVGLIEIDGVLEGREEIGGRTHGAGIVSQVEGERERGRRAEGENNQGNE